MAVMPGLQINIGQSQQLKLTPQLQQSIKVLQQSALEIQTMVEQTLEENIFLELDQDEEDVLADDSAALDAQDEATTEGSLSSEEDSATTDTALGNDLETDASWEDIYQDDPIPSLALTHSGDAEEWTAPENYTAEQRSLHDHLLWQAEIHEWDSDLDQLIAQYIIDALDDDGYVDEPLQTIAQAISEHAELPITEERVESVLKVVQTFEPAGVAARDLQECLLLQLNADTRDGPTTALLEQARDLISNHFELLSTHQFNRIKRRYKLNDDQLEALIHFIQSLEPRPGRAFAVVENDYVVPDLILTRRGDRFVLELNSEAYPRLRLNPEYIQLAEQIKDPSQANALKEKQQEARLLIKSLQHRGETLLRVGRYIVDRQQRFFEEGEKAMQPMVLREVAEALDLHESTISRATNQKYIQTPRGTYELKYFFSSGVAQYGQDDQSATAIKSYLREFIDAEDPRKPLSDSKLVKLLEEKGIHVARRTIAKYRESMGIPASSERKKINYFK
ncbi:RNA polymerase, sigma 54 subunit, RpoN/SigL [Sulfurivirga caldicuralii]|uniref:RNA polymerase sigma-54 factor n=1 Tax=Sulfurivirga caldicuralii TaxID=364032 RepID=A0A1N6FAM2_9GAMM|nr:RNA polymerase factor sigma-54 [Sulfurivirga caldicuralii]SIN92319.1 RNA polymerase, sigma 54 subunit, RpoN/SigL [Sulfurivirga caldicuralii]